MTQIAVVVPVYQGEATIDALAQELIPVLERVAPDFDVLLVDDGSTDGSWARIEAIVAQHTRVRGLSLIRNFGEHVAITAGIDHVDARHTIVMACDLQDDPAVIPEMIAKAQEGYDLVLVRRLKRKDAWLKRLLARLFYFSTWLLFRVDYDYRVGNYRLISRRAVEYFRQHRERARNVNAILALMGLRTAYVDMVHRARRHGRSTYTLSRSALVAANVLLGYSNVPLLASGFVGVLLVTGALVAGAWFAVDALRGRAVSGAGVTVASVAAVGGLVLINLGIVGAYLGRAATEAKERPMYFIAARTGRF